MKKVTLEAIIEELEKSRRDHQGNADMMTALTEEVGELAKALLDQKYKNAPARDVFAEAVQVAVTVIRIAEEGDRNFPYAFAEVFPDETENVSSPTG